MTLKYQLIYELYYMPKWVHNKAPLSPEALYERDTKEKWKSTKLTMVSPELSGIEAFYCAVWKK